jgi:hypothetical protein
MTTAPQTKFVDDNSLLRHGLKGLNATRGHTESVTTQTVLPVRASKGHELATDNGLELVQQESATRRTAVVADTKATSASTSTGPELTYNSSQPEYVITVTEEITSDETPCVLGLTDPTLQSKPFRAEVINEAVETSSGIDLNISPQHEDVSSTFISEDTKSEAHNVLTTTTPHDAPTDKGEAKTSTVTELINKTPQFESGQTTAKSGIENDEKSSVKSEPSQRSFTGEATNAEVFILAEVTNKRTHSGPGPVTVISAEIFSKPEQTNDTQHSEIFSTTTAVNETIISEISRPPEVFSNKSQFEPVQIKLMSENTIPEMFNGPEVTNKTQFEAAAMRVETEANTGKISSRLEVTTTTTQPASFQTRRNTQMDIGVTSSKRELIQSTAKPHVLSTITTSGPKRNDTNIIPELTNITLKPEPSSTSDLNKTTTVENSRASNVTNNISEFEKTNIKGTKKITDSDMSIEQELGKCTIKKLSVQRRPKRDTENDAISSIMGITNRAKNIKSLATKDVKNIIASKIIAAQELINTTKQSVMHSIPLGLPGLTNKSFKSGSDKSDVIIEVTISETSGEHNLTDSTPKSGSVQAKPRKDNKNLPKNAPVELKNISHPRIYNTRNINENKNGEETRLQELTSITPHYKQFPTTIIINNTTDEVETLLETIYTTPQSEAFTTNLITETTTAEGPTLLELTSTTPQSETFTTLNMNDSTAPDVPNLLELSSTKSNSETFSTTLLYMNSSSNVEVLLELSTTRPRSEEFTETFINAAANPETPSVLELTTATRNSEPINTTEIIETTTAIVPSLPELIHITSRANPLPMGDLTLFTDNAASTGIGLSNSVQHSEPNSTPVIWDATTGEASSEQGSTNSSPLYDLVRKTVLSEAEATEPLGGLDLRSSAHQSDSVLSVDVPQNSSGNASTGLELTHFTSNSVLFPSSFGTPGNPSTGNEIPITTPQSGFFPSTVGTPANSSTENEIPNTTPQSGLFPSTVGTPVNTSTGNEIPITTPQSGFFPSSVGTPVSTSTGSEIPITTPQSDFFSPNVGTTVSASTAIGVTNTTSQSEFFSPIYNTTKEVLTSSTNFVTKAPKSPSNITSAGVSNYTSRPESPVLPPIPFKWKPKRRTQVFRCRRPGRFPSWSSCTEYHVCRRGWGRLFHIKERCPPGHGFSSRLSFCVPKRLLSGCKADRIPDERISSTIRDDRMRWLHKKRKIH